ncbi:hypothetical protein A3F27_02420 [Candidatus Kaiserbacteria bacterium RIFCSPHIGHO2_12_FULL_53_13]|uniref:Uncharacterized protein n=1 Tax=Candidatus Kaiserbacteria bacterium RIFCSPHIGHO2_12_FULL_53_13 TaxID=1798502 RepID=A0A1F6ECD4_9BACT|nr:MAG: hypothetical protein A3F27_02420 [Candidatus Kaiserbacteria bacterium RIFCSPHIGHO2_12_FULL_53_13]OGG74629.1 MAG: hypothetical protein A3A37_01885 [Candidatus Kaiserbacteria bacterium RIFCSPLOWO2_01_FULL_52_36]
MASFEKFVQQVKKLSGFERIPQHTHKVALSSALETVSSELTKTPDRRIRTPFDLPIAKGSIKKEDLEKWGVQPIELGGLHDRDGTLIVSTGHPVSTGYDWPDNTYDLYSPSQKFARDANYLADKRRDYKQPFHIHNHPPTPEASSRSGPIGRIERERAAPSWSDLIHSPVELIMADMILTKSSVILYKFKSYEHKREVLSDKQAYQENSMTENLNMLRSREVIIAEIPFSDPRINAVLDFMNGVTTWEETRQKIVGT